MSYPKKPVTKTKTPETKGPPKMSEEKREKLLKIQQREELKGVLANKFIEKYAKDKKVDQDFINKQVTELMKNEKLTEENLRKLEDKIKDKTGGAKGGSVKDAISPGKEPSVRDKKEFAEDRSLKEAPKNASHVHHAHDDDDAYSVTSSTKPRSVYAQGDSDDEWATMMKYDTELYKKEKDFEKIREHETKQKIKAELDRQIAEKNRLKEQEREEMRRYNDLVGNQMQNFDVKEKRKEEDMKSKIMAEKASRDKQLQDENLRKKLDRKAEKEMDSMVVHKIRNELDTEARRAQERRLEEKDNLRKVLVENEEYKLKMAEEAKKSKEQDVKAQQEYTRLIERQEAERAAELKAREDRAKKLMGMMADTVVKDQKEAILEEERKLLKHTLDKEEREMDDEKKRQQRINEQKKDLKKYLDQQLEEKERRRQEELELEKRQAQIWKKDVEDYTEHEKNKSEYIKDVNKKHADFLKQQITADNIKHKKMNPQELLLNKGKLKEIAVKHDDPKFQKHLMDPKQK